MSNTYKLYAKLDGIKILEAKTEIFINDIQEWTQIGTYNNRHYQVKLLNSYRVPLYEWVNDTITARDPTDVTNDTNAVIAQRLADKKDVTKAAPILKALAFVVGDLCGKTPAQMKTLIQNKL